MKKLILLVLVVTAAIFGYKSFINPAPAAADERVLADLEHQFDTAARTMATALRSGGMSGMDTTADVEAARASARRVEAELQRIKPTLPSEAARRRAERLHETVKAFLEANN
jgi:H2-forming N5,N10-methylenetetrahydromethanopterin dehydrogenase-like enzyme